ncbi:MAG: PAS domain-containing protein, partial [Chthoniobacterales bacterium]
MEKYLKESSRWYFIGLPAVIACLILGGILTLFISMQQRRGEQRYESDHLDAWVKALRVSMSRQQEVAASVWGSVQNSPELMQVLANASDDKGKAEAKRYLKKVQSPSLNVFKHTGLVAADYWLPDGELLQQMYPGKEDSRLLQIVASMMAMTDSTLISQSAFVESPTFEGFRFIYPLFSDKKHVANLDIGFSPNAVTGFLRRSRSGWCDFGVKATLLTKERRNDFAENYKPSEFLPGYFVLTDSDIEEDSRLDATSSVSEEWSGVEVAAREAFARLLTQGSSGITSFEHGGKYWDALVYPQTDLSGAVVGQFFAIQENLFLATLYSDTKRNIIAAWACTFLAVLLFSMSYLQRQWLLESRVEAVGMLENIGKTIPGVVYQSQYWPDTKQSLMKFVSPGMKKLFFQPLEKFLKEPNLWLECILPEDRKKVEDSMAICAKELKPWAEEFRIKTKDGRTTWREVKAQPALQKDGSILWNGFLAEADERKLAEKALSESEQRFRDMAEAAGEYLWEIDSEGRYTLLSHGAGKVFGISKELALYKHPEDFAPPENKEWVSQVWKSIREKETAFRELEFCIQRSNGNLAWVRYSGTPFLNSSGLFAGFRGTGLDVTREKLAEQRMMRMNEDLQLSQRIAKLGGWSWDVGSDKLVCTEELFRILGIKSASHEIDLKEIEKNFEDSALARIDRFVDLALKFGERNVFEVLAKKTNASDAHEHINILIRLEPDLSENGGVRRLYGCMQDVSEMHRAREA